MIPRVTVFSNNPNVKPIVITFWPTRAVVAEPNGRIDYWAPGWSTWRIARSSSGATFVTRDRMAQAGPFSVTLQFPEMTYSFVTTTPGATEKPVPRPAELSIGTMAGRAALITPSSAGGASENTGRVELTLGVRGTGIRATGGRVAGTRAGTNSSWGAPAGVSDAPGSERALEEDAGGAVSGDDHCTASTTRRAMLKLPQTQSPWHSRARSPCLWDWRRSRWLDSTAVFVPITAEAHAIRYLPTAAGTDPHERTASRLL